MNLWTSEETTGILIQLDAMGLPFAGYSLRRTAKGLNLLGRGGSGEVYEAYNKRTHKCSYAVKVIGFRSMNVDSDFFNESVEAQKEAAGVRNDVVKIYDHTEIWVTCDERDNVISAVKKQPENASRATIKLQFILMEKIPAVISRTRNGNIKLLPEKLAGSEWEILNLAFDVGSALKSAHDKKVLHRDVKLENVFYSKKDNHYKLGDFGTAKKTDNGFAETIAFTKGYAAPEVRATDEKYDNTADIYSFGMMLYVLANGLKFPESNSYNVNPTIQYTPGYIVPRPEGKISDELYRIIAKACNYDPDKRYQSMDEMLPDIEGLLYGSRLGYKAEHKKASLAMGLIMLLSGAAAWKLTMATELVVELYPWEYVFIAACLVKGILGLYKKKISFISLCIFGLGVYLLVSTGFSWIKLLILLFMTFSYGDMSFAPGLMSGTLLVVNLASLAQQSDATNLTADAQYNWVAVSLLSLSAFLLFQYLLLVWRERRLLEVYYKGNLYYITISLLYACCIVIEYTTTPVTAWVRTLFGDAFDIGRVGICGLGFSLFWAMRERIMMRRR